MDNEKRRKEFLLFDLQLGKSCASSLHLMRDATTTVIADDGSHYRTTNLVVVIDVLALGWLWVIDFCIGISCD